MLASEIVTPRLGLLADFPALVAREFGGQSPVVFTDSHLAEAYRNQLEAFAPRLLEIIPAGESSKCFESVVSSCERMAAAGVERCTPVVAFGGGVVGDLGGFAASIYMRGLPLVQVPTSLVAMVDSSLGGKVGINLPKAKNMVGNFHPARLILQDPTLLRSLPKQEFANGMAEAIKHALIDGGEHWSWIKTLHPSPPSLLGPVADWSDISLQLLVQRSGKVKLDIVEQDPEERGVRAHLNLGHTLGHALEAVLGYQGLGHGQAVAIGLICALRLSQKLDALPDASLIEEVSDLLQRWGLPTRVPVGLAWEGVRAAMQNDKKVRDGRLRFVLLSVPGKVWLQSGIDPALVRQVFEELQCEP